MDLWTDPMICAAFSKVFVNEAYVSQIEGLPEATASFPVVSEKLQSLTT